MKPTRRTFLKALGLGAGAVLGACHRAGPRGPNIVFVLLDTLRADRLGAERGGVAITPNLARFAERAVVFTDAVTQCTWTKPAMASLFTSLYVDTHQVYYGADDKMEGFVADVLPQSYETMAAFLKKAGYHTAAVQSNANLAADFGFAQGFDQYRFIGDVPADEVNRTALTQLETMKPPYFLYVHYMDPHAPYTPPAAYRSVFGPLPEVPKEERYLINHFMDYLLDQAYHFLGVSSERKYNNLSPEGCEAVKMLYDGEVRFLDDELARFLHAVERKSPNTLIILLSDHGEELWEHGSLGHGTTMYEEQLAVPLLIQGPGLTPRRVDTQVETFGILPTLAAYLGLEPNPHWQGRDLLAPAGQGPGPAFSSTRATWPRVNLHTEMVRKDRLKLIVKHKRGETELYDLHSDPGERRDILAQQPGIGKELGALLTQHLQHNLAARREEPVGPETPIDPEILEQLKAIGYMGR